MAYSSLIGTARAAAVPSGRDTGSLAPSDSSGSGSDLAGLDTADDGDPTLPIDAVLGADRAATPTSAEGLSADSDAAETGERRNAGGDAGRDGGEHEDDNDEEDDEDHETPRKEEHPSGARWR